MEKFNGWENRETWSVSSLIANDEELYKRFNAEADEVLRECRDLPQFNPINMLARRIEAFWQAESDYYTESLNRLAVEPRLRLRFIGSLWRVNWEEIADSILSNRR